MITGAFTDLLAAPAPATRHLHFWMALAYNGVSWLWSFALIGLFLRPGPREDRQGLDFMVAAMAFTIASPVVWDHHYGVTPAMFLVALAVMRDLYNRGQPVMLYAVLFLFACVMISGTFFSMTAPFLAGPCCPPVLPGRRWRWWLSSSSAFAAPVCIT